MNPINFTWDLLPQIFLWFLIYSFLGWAWECILVFFEEHRFVNRGFLNGPYCPIYGLGAILFIFTTNTLANPILRFALGATLACALEYVTSFLLELLFHARWWDYSQYRYNLHGRICLIGFALFGFFAVVIPYVQYYFQAFIESLPASLTNSLASILSIVFIADIAITVRSLAHFNHILRVYQQAIDKHRIQFLEFIHRGRHTFTMYLGKNRTIRHVLTLQQRRILAAFPQLTSLHYKGALERLRKLSKEPNSATKQKQKDAK